MADPPEHLDWHHCYEDNWNGLITPESFAHPAKMSRGLLSRILAFGFERGYWQKGDVIGDCFGGVGTTGILGASAGLKVVSVELEPRFHALAEANYGLHADLWRRCGDPVPQMICGDSRKFAELVGPVVGMITSPPYAEGLSHGGQGSSPNLPHDTCGTARSMRDRYGHTAGQIGALKEGTLEGVVTSPPWEESVGSTDKKFRSEGLAQGAGKWAQNRSEASVENLTSDYGASPGQLGTTSGETYWQAMKVIYGECQKALKPGGMLVAVIKDYVKNKARVPLCDQTATLLEACGFKMEVRVRAMLVKESRDVDLFGGDTVKLKERKSFFRRLAEKKGSPRIDWEEVLFARRCDANVS